ncbi:hypothetical protein AKN92_07410 [Thiopseudomonas alkaliphila]|nr:hypothetical protein AKN92_07410 [Thiopseudomonas alkaliphila]
MKRALFLGVALLGGLTACQMGGKNQKSDQEVFYVKENLVDCVGVAPMKCMQVKRDTSEEWSYFYSQIIGFKYEPGYRYKLKVQVEDVENPPADASSKRYTLISIIEKVKQS